MPSHHSPPLDTSWLLQFSPSKFQKTMPPPLQSCAFPTAKPLSGISAASPTAVACDLPAAPSTTTTSQPGTATSSLGGAAAESCCSRSSSAADLGDRSKLLLINSLHPATMRPAAPAAQQQHSEEAQGADGAGRLEPEGDGDDGEEDGSQCSPKLIGAVRTFDRLVLQSLTPIKTRGRAPAEAQPAWEGTTWPEGGSGSAGQDGSAAAAGPELSPPVAYVESLVSPFDQEDSCGGLRTKLMPSGRGPIAIHARSSSSGMAAAPGAYNPYCPAAAAMAAGECASRAPLCCWPTTSMLDAVCTCTCIAAVLLCQPPPFAACVQSTAPPPNRCPRALQPPPPHPPASSSSRGEGGARRPTSPWRHAMPWPRCVRGGDGRGACTALHCIACAAPRAQR